MTQAKPKRGVDAHMPEDTLKPDLFEEQVLYFHFPCGMCKHKKQPESYCRQCRHWAEDDDR